MTIDETLRKQMEQRKYQIRHLYVEGEDIRLSLKTTSPPFRLLRDAVLRFRQVTSVSVRAGNPYEPTHAGSTWTPVPISDGKMTDWKITGLTFVAGRIAMDVHELREEGPVQAGMDVVGIECGGMEFSDSVAWDRSLLMLLQTPPIVIPAALLAFLAPGGLMMLLVPAHPAAALFVTQAIILGILGGKGLAEVFWNWPIAALALSVFLLILLGSCSLIAAGNPWWSLGMIGDVVGFFGFLKLRSSTLWPPTAK